jgi:hypothetical protein
MLRRSASYGRCAQGCNSEASVLVWARGGLGSLLVGLEHTHRSARPVPSKGGSINASYRSGERALALRVTPDSLR